MKGCSKHCMAIKQHLQHISQNSFIERLIDAQLQGLVVLASMRTPFVVQPESHLAVRQVMFGIAHRSPQSPYFSANSPHCN